MKLNNQRKLYESDRFSVMVGTNLPNEEWEQKVSFTPLHTSEKQKVEFRLYRDYDAEPNFTIQLCLYINVIDPQPGGKH